MSTPSLLASADDVLIAELLRLAAAAGSPVDVVGDTDALLRGWADAPLVLVGADRAGDLAGRRPSRRDGVHLVGHAPLPDVAFRHALAVGARDVVELPAGGEHLVELLTDAVDGAAGLAPALGLVAGSGGAGASTLAAATALVAARTRQAVLADLDPWGSGQDRLVGVEDRAGVRWEALADGDGRLGSRSLLASLPSLDRLAVLGYAPAPGRAPATPAPDVVVEVLAAAQRGSGLVVVDLPRRLDGAAAEVAVRCTAVVVTCCDTVGSAVAAARVAARLAALQPRVGLAVRRTRGGAPPDRLAAVLGVPVLVDYPSRRSVTEHVDLGLGPVHARRSPLARAAADLVACADAGAPPW